MDKKNKIISLATRFVCDGCRIHCHLNAEEKPYKGNCFFQLDGMIDNEWFELDHNNCVKEE
jgi:hypothetical protein